ncbi:SAC3/GANP/Nin1/mts3/eIF-3 p25 family [Wolffia australiana]
MMNPGSGFGSNVGPLTKFRRDTPVLFGNLSPNPVTGSITKPVPVEPPATRSIPLQSAVEPVRNDSSRVHSHQEPHNRISTKKIPFEASQAAADNEGKSPTEISSKFHGPKRSRSPSQGNVDTALSMSLSNEQDLERETKAKAKRLARFHAELSQPRDESSQISKNFTGSRTSLVPAGAVKTPTNIGKKADTLTDRSLDGEGMEVFAPIRGVCPDMCPESERGERERKGDLDQYERLDGDRHQTSVSLAVKKYTRTAERDAKLIRPMPVLRKTVDYLLNLLKHPYNDQLLGLYNFLWDRMRAVRMDLRMQHIFNSDSIEMLEQMIRLHIIAMHELAEYPKGEGFSEGFDAHLNIEQMNKTSVELFQMYDDHRRRGCIISSEKEFRGYYALLKLDKHPGYRVEPSELSLNLAKMSPDVRHSPEIVFARDVARACRTGNFIAFFRLARKATYLQACLMHAHFSKLRTQAFASLHSGIQINQGIPIEHVEKWLAIEGEDVDSLLEYYGFSVKRFEEPYMVKGGPFLNGDVDYPTKSSQLVKMKRSKTIVEDVRRSQAVILPHKLPSNVLNEIKRQEIKVHIPEVVIDMASDKKPDNVLADLGSSEIMEPPMSPAEQNLPSTSSERATESEMDDDDDIQMEKYDEAISVVSFTSFKSPLSNDDGPPLLQPSPDSALDEAPSPHMIGISVQAEVQARSESCLKTNNLNVHAAESLKHEASVARLRKILRRWKQTASRKRERRVQRLSLAHTALNSLSLGPPLRQTALMAKEGHRLNGNLDIDKVAKKRYLNYERSWAQLNVSEAIAPALSTRNPHAKCLVWKLAICLQRGYSEEDEDELLFSSWLLWKLMGSPGREEDEELVFFSPVLSIWRKIENSSKIDSTSSYCCYSVVREFSFQSNSQLNVDDDPSAVAGLSAMIFLASEDIPWGTQRDRLHKILDSIPAGSSLPLIILMSYSSTYPKCDQSAVIEGLGLGSQRRKATISSLRVIHFDENHKRGCFFSDDNLLRDCLQWLAENSPRQPSLHRIRPRDLVMSSLSSHLTALENSSISPNDCVTLFNKTLDDAAEEIRAAAAANSNGWPAPEMASVPYQDAQFTINWLPSADWSSWRKIEPILSAIKRCKLQNFPNDWLQISRQGCEVLGDLAKQKAALEFCLLGYLLRSVGLASESLASLEARVMVQKGASLERRGLRHFIVPDWITIFRRIYNWRLMGLSTLGNSSVAFVLMENRVPSVQQLVQLVQSRPRRVLLEDLNFETDDGDEPESTVSTAQGAADSIFHGSAIGRGADTCRESEAVVFRTGRNLKGTVGIFDEESKERAADRLKMLLEKCGKLQDSIGRKLAVYF